MKSSLLSVLCASAVAADPGFLRHLQTETTVNRRCAAPNNFISDTVFIAFAKVDPTNPDSHIFVQATEFAADANVTAAVESAFISTYNSLATESFCDPNFITLDSADIASEFSKLRVSSFEIQINIVGTCRGCSDFTSIFDVGEEAMGFSGSRTCTCPADATVGAPTESAFTTAFSAALEALDVEGIPPFFAVDQRTRVPSMVPSSSPSLADSSMPSVSISPTVGPTPRPTPFPTTSPAPTVTGVPTSSEPPTVTPSVSLSPSGTQVPTAAGRRNLKSEIKALFGKLRGNN